MLREVPRLLALAAVIAGLWLVIYQRPFPHSLGTPIVYAGGDELWVHAEVKAVADGEIGLFGSKRVSRDSARRSERTGMTLPSSPNDVSNEPSELKRATTKSPATTDLPSTWMATARAAELLLPTLSRRTPSPLKAVSSVPLALKRAIPKSPAEAPIASAAQSARIP